MSDLNNIAILLDLDGTLVDTVYPHVAAWSDALRSAGLQVPSWKIHRRIGMSGRSLLRQVMREHASGRIKIDPEKAEKKHSELFRKATRRIVPLPGAQELLGALTQHGVRWAIASTGKRKQVSRLLRALRIPADTVIVTGDDVEKAKPSPDIFVAAARRLKVPVADCIVVGDSVWDMLAAGRRRALAVGLLSGGYSRAELEEAGAFRVYSDPADLLEHIEDLGIE